MSVHEYIREERLTAAHSCVITTAESFEEISEKLGYRSFSHFNKIFKARFGITPSALRKNHAFRTI